MNKKIDPAEIDHLVTSYIVTKLIVGVMDNTSSFNKEIDDSEKTQIAYSEFNEYIDQKGKL
jgi:hypothetical protein